MPELTVIMPSLNVSVYIEECIQSAIGQSMKDIEIICVDAGSTDGTIEILQKYALKDTRIRIIHSDVKSYGHQVNMGIKAAHGKYIAILETDDYIADNMYENLVRIMDKYRLDIIKADYDCFWTQKNGIRIFERVKSFSGKRKEWYNKVVSAEALPEIHRFDISVWKGAYRRAFLINNDIFFNETLGAAYQDICFHHISMAYVQRMMYIPESYYRYRRDNENSSSNCTKGLKYLAQEYEILFQKQYINDMFGKEQLKNIVVRMFDAFCWEYSKVIEYNMALPKDYYGDVDWIRDIIKRLIEDKTIAVDDFSNESVKSLGDFIYNYKEFEDSYVEKAKSRKAAVCQYIEYLHGRSIVIFGCGKCGMEVLLFLDGKNIRVGAFADNCAKKWGGTVGGVEVMSPQKAVQKYSGAVYIVANKNNSSDMKQQLVDLNIKEKDILVWE